MTFNFQQAEKKQKRKNKLWSVAHKSKIFTIGPKQKTFSDPYKKNCYFPNFLGKVQCNSCSVLYFAFFKRIFKKEKSNLHLNHLKIGS